LAYFGMWKLAPHEFSRNGRTPYPDRCLPATGAHMTELLGWMILVGLAVNIIGIYMLSYQIEKQTRTTLEFILQSNEMILGHLQRPASGDRPVASAEERRRAQRRNPLARLFDAARGERRTIPHRRLEDILQH